MQRVTEPRPRGSGHRRTFPQSHFCLSWFCATGSLRPTPISSLSASRSFPIGIRRDLGTVPAQTHADRPGNDAIQPDLLHNYTANVALYDNWHEYFRKHQPRTLILWGQNDPFFTVEGAKAFQRDLPKAELHLLAGGHFALQEHSQLIADEMTRFLTNAERKAA